MLHLILALTLAAFGGNSERTLGKAMADVECGQTVLPEWQTYMDLGSGFVVYQSPYDHRFFGKVPDAYIETYNGYVIGLIFFVDQERPSKYKQSKKVWSWMNKHYGAPVISDPIWVWPMHEVSWLYAFMMGSTGESMALKFNCML